MVRNLRAGYAAGEKVLRNGLRDRTAAARPPFPGIELWAFPVEENGCGASGALIKMEGGPSGGNSTLVYFTCEDCAVEEARVGKAGGHVEETKMSIGEYGFIALVRDPDGNMIGLHSMK